MLLLLDLGRIMGIMEVFTEVSTAYECWKKGRCANVIRKGDNSNGDEVALELPYRVGDTVGCGVDLTTRTIWYTRNGAKLESGFENVQGRLFPLLGLSDDVSLETNFTGPFVWKGDVAPEDAGESDEAVQS